MRLVVILVMEVDFSCNVEWCNDLIDCTVSNGLYCAFHAGRIRRYGIPDPKMECYGCHIEFFWRTRRFKSNVYCDNCIKVFSENAIWIPKETGSITNHGIKVISYLNLLVQQEFKCGLCHVGFENQRIVIDHDHKCCKGTYACKKCIRGLLCYRCNQVMGFVDSQIDMEAIEIYQKSRPLGDYYG